MNTTAKERIKIASFDFTSCEGCQLSKINLEDEIVPLVQNFLEFVTFREAMDPISDDYVIAFIEGSISTPKGVKRLRKIRKKAKILIAMGHCATHGGIQAMRNSRDQGEVIKEGYPGFESMPHLKSLPWSLPVEKVVTVDYMIPGCPMDKNEFLRVVQALLLGKEPSMPDYAVCVECKRNENECVHDLGYSCMGPVTLAGCGARCPNSASPCIGCRGIVPDMNRSAQEEVLGRVGMTADEVAKKFTWFSSYLDLESRKDKIQSVLSQISEDE